MLFDLTGKTAVITGGGSGIGRSIALLFGQHDAHVNILDVSKEEAEEVALELQHSGGRAVSHQCNVADWEEVLATFEEIATSTGAIDILVNSAGVAHVGKIENTTDEDFDRIFAVNVKGTYHCMRAAVQKMKGKGGVILNLASIAASVGLPDRFAYSMSKGAVVTMTYSVARDYVDQNIRCNCISPARVHTPFVDGFLQKNYPGQEKEMFEKLSKTQPIGRMANPEEIANLALYLCSNEASFVTGSNYLIDGGFVTLNT
ncbi:MAG: SDR family oxidoreductase [Ignavibacteria bacterium]|nr:SDR family oxidoreductase [Ignavibacteria bacterium]MBI3766028.1 SDR family oxidoreductase [Ignavibacteriales bacterium]